MPFGGPLFQQLDGRPEVRKAIVVVVRTNLIVDVTQAFRAGPQDLLERGAPVVAHVAWVVGAFSLNKEETFGAKGRIGIQYR